MKKILIILAAVIVLAVVGIVIFIATFNIDTYKGALITQLESLTGNTVEIGHLSMEWKGRMMMEADKFVILVEEPGGQKVPALSFDRASAVVDLMPLLTRQLQISSISIDRPQIAIIRTEEGKITVRGYDPRKAAVAPAGASDSGLSTKKAAVKAGASGAAAFGFNINSIVINDGAVRFVDLSGQPPTDIIIRKFDATLRNVSAATPITFSVKAAVAGERQDVDLSGTIGGFLTGNIFLKDFSLETDLSSFGHAEILQALPALGKMGLRPGLAGMLRAKVREMRIADHKVASITGDVKFTGGRLVLAQTRVPIEQIELDASAEGTTVTVRSFSARLANGILKGASTIENAFTAPRTSLELVAQADGLNKFLTAALEFGINLDGNARISFKGSMTGTAWPEISRTLAGAGTLSLENGVIANANMINETLGALTLFPDLLTSVEGKVPPPVQQMMVEKYTFLQPFNQSFRVDGGYIILPDLVFASTDMAMRGEGKISFTGDLSGNGMIRFSPAISNAIVATIPQLRAIADTQGLITFPLAFKGGSGKFKVIPDLKYIGKRVAVQTAGDAVSGYLQKALGDGQQSGAAQAAGGEPASPAKVPKLKDLLKAFAEQSKSSK